MAKRHFGDIDGFREGAQFNTFSELHKSGVHRQTVKGIVGGESEGAESIVLNGGYEDDKDLGDEIIYTGEGGRDERTKKQISDQHFTGGNKALAVNKAHGIPVRVIRGYKLNSPFAPKSGYRYDGPYTVESFGNVTGKSGFKVWQYELVKATPKVPEVKEGELPPQKPERRTTTVIRTVRDTELSRSIKKDYDFTCQVCRKRLSGPLGAYAEGAHIRPLGKPHDGPDVRENILCLCPNHHTLLDLFAITIADDLGLIGMKGRLSVKKGHRIGPEYIGYHRSQYDAIRT